MPLICLRCAAHASPSLTLVPSRTFFSGLRERIDFFKTRKKTLSREEDILLQPPALSSTTPVPAAAPQKTSMWQDLTEEEVDRIRFKSGLPKEILCEQRGIPVHGTRFTYLEHYRRDFVRQYFATYGKASGLKPGVCWPHKEELAFRIKWEETFYPKFNDMVQRKKDEREQKAKELAKYRAQIMANLKKLPAAKKEFFAKLNERKQQELDEKAKREKVLQDVREYLGYDVSQGDTRFQEALAKKEEEEAAVRKASKKTEKQSKIMASLAALAEEQIKKAAEAAEKEKTGESGPVTAAPDETKSGKGTKTTDKKK